MVRQDLGERVVFAALGGIVGLDGMDMTGEQVNMVDVCSLTKGVHLYQQCAGLPDWLLTVAVQVVWIFLLRALSRAMWQKRLDNMIVQGG